MAGISRRTLATGLGASSLLTLAAPHVARAAKFELRYGNNLPVSHPLNQRAQEFAAEIAKRTDGAVTVSIFPNNQLGGDTDMLSQVRAGALTFFTPSSLVIATLVPVAAINAVGFAFASYDQVWAAMDGALGGFIRGAIDRAGLHTLETVWDNGFRQTTTSGKPIGTAADFAGVKIRVPVSPLSISLFQALGASPTSLQFSEVYSALQTKIVDAQENPLPIVQVAKLYEVQRYCSLTNHQLDGYWFIANGRAWSGLPAEMQKIVSDAINGAGLRQRDDIKALNVHVQDDLQSKGLAFNQPDTESFRGKLRGAGFYADWKGKFGAEAWGLLEQATGQLA